MNWGDIQELEELEEKTKHVCIFFNLAQGCYKGDKCRFKHIKTTHNKLKSLKQCPYCFNKCLGKQCSSCHQKSKSISN